mmetsp:Transcript_53253/g.123994  ORF Transcript_53253/g.123994 Transcript_53253/m.123994 type:complete len:218 (-) Transcript_53253:288-941(-)
MVVRRRRLEKGSPLLRRLGRTPRNSVPKCTAFQRAFRKLGSMLTPWFKNRQFLPNTSSWRYPVRVSKPSEQLIKGQSFRLGSAKVTEQEVRRIESTTASPTPTRSALLLAGAGIAGLARAVPAGITPASPVVLATAAPRPPTLRLSIRMSSSSRHNLRAASTPPTRMLSNTGANSGSSSKARKPSFCTKVLPASKVGASGASCCMLQGVDFPLMPPK